MPSWLPEAAAIGLLNEPDTLVLIQSLPELRLFKRTEKSRDPLKSGFKRISTERGCPQPQRAISSLTMYVLNGFRQSTPPHNRHLNILISNSKH